MATPTPLSQQRQIVRDFLAANQRRSQRENAAQQQYAAGEKAAEQQYRDATGQQDNEKNRRREQVHQCAISIDENSSQAAANLRSLGVPTADLPPALEIARPRPSVADADATPLPKFLAAAGQTGSLREDANQLVNELRRRRKQQRRMLIATPIIVMLLMAAGYFFYQQWSFDQKVANLYQFGVAALEAGEWQTARDQFSELLQLKPGYADAQTLVYESYYRPGKAAIEAGDWQTAWEQFGKLLRLQPDYMEARSLINQHAQEIGSVVNPIDQALYVVVPAGDFIMGSPVEIGNDDEHHQHTVYLDAYWIMQTEVTNAQYAQCVAAGACSAPNNNSWHKADRVALPVTSVNWNQASAYAHWAGGRLPTEAEWEKAARGVDGRIYPWGNEQPTADLANCCRYVHDLTPVGSYPAGASPYGALDMAGNVWEWTADWYAEDYYFDSPSRNPTGSISGQYKAMRGGAWTYAGSGTRTAIRHFNPPGFGGNAVGFRVAFAGY